MTYRKMAEIPPHPVKAMKTASTPHKSRFSPATIAIGVVALAGLFGATGYAIALATRPATTVAPVAVVPPVEKKAEPVAEKIEPKPVAKKVVPAVKKAWTFDEALEEAKAMAERLKDEDFEEAKKNLTRADIEGIILSYDTLSKGRHSELSSGVNNRAYSIANNIGMTNYFNKRIARWSFKDKFFTQCAKYTWSKVESYRTPEAILHSAILYGYDDAQIEACAHTPGDNYQAPNQTVKIFWENFAGCRWSDFSK